MSFSLSWVIAEGEWGRAAEAIRTRVSDDSEGLLFDDWLLGGRLTFEFDGVSARLVEDEDLRLRSLARLPVNVVALPETSVQSALEHGFEVAHFELLSAFTAEFRRAPAPTEGGPPVWLGTYVMYDSGSVFGIVADSATTWILSADPVEAGFALSVSNTAFDLAVERYLGEVCQEAVVRVPGFSSLGSVRSRLRRFL